jgi:antitoxin component of RelBE/YafQ-DinJ toxin-antitoxin module
MKNTQLQIRINEKLKEKFKQLADEKEMSASELLTYLIRKELGE